jgi:hypothetical protein
MLFTSTLFKAYMKNCDWMQVKQRQLPFFLPSSFPWSALSSVSSASLSISTLLPTLCLFSVYILHCCSFAEFQAVLYPLNMFHQKLCVNSGAVSLTLHHNIWHIIHKNWTLYPYRTKNSAKLTVDNPESCLLWKCLNSNRWLRRVLPRPWK